jgi:hypothetical protein
MHAGRQILLLGDPPQQLEQLGALVAVERGGHRKLVRAGNAGELA